ncbi:MAG TPA: peptidoglycan-binding domain-containing protein [Gemmatimonadales bacterium]|nr:peptidoglycan-binding domain-containing protein [Gemmatimonadales bacterium]
MRTFSLAAALTALTLSASALAAQSTSQQPATKPAMSQSSAVHVKQDSTKKAATTSASATKKSTATRHAAWTKDDIKQAQEGLTKAGLYKGKTSGIMNADTRKALREYQKQNKLPVTGRLSDSVLVKLKSA